MGQQNSVISGVDDSPISMTAKKIPRVSYQSMTSTHIPSSAQADLALRSGLTADQCDTVLQLICLPENGRKEWWKHYNFIKRLGDGRGYTATIFGACSGTGDLMMILDALATIKSDHALLKYRPALKKCRGEDVTGIQGMLIDVPALGEDDAWQRAVWRVYVDLYWKFAARYAARTGECAKRPGPVLQTPLGKGFMVDTAINHGADVGCFDKIIKRMRRPDATNEIDWLTDFMKTRKKMLATGFEQLDTSKTGDRCRLWTKLLKEGNTQLLRPITAYSGYWGRDVLIT